MKQFKYEDMPEWYEDDQSESLDQNMLRWVIDEVRAIIKSNSVYLNRISACSIGHNITVSNTNPRSITVETPMYPEGKHVATALLEFTIVDKFDLSNTMTWDEKFKLYDFGIDELTNEVDLSKMEALGNSLQPDEGDGPAGSMTFEEEEAKQAEWAELAEKEKLMELDDGTAQDVEVVNDSTTSNSVG